MLSQAEHGPDSPAILVTNSEAVGRQTQQWVEKLLPILPTANVAGVAWESFGEIIVTDSLDEAYAVADEYVAEHVEILTQNPREALDKMSNYGALFLGENTCVSYGDKVSRGGTLVSRSAGTETGYSASERATSCPRAKRPNSLEASG